MNVKEAFNSCHERLEHFPSDTLACAITFAGLVCPSKWWWSWALRPHLAARFHFVVVKFAISGMLRFDAECLRDWALFAVAFSSDYWGANNIGGSLRYATRLQIRCWFRCLTKHASAVGARCRDWYALAHILQKKHCNQNTAHESEIRVFYKGSHGRMRVIYDNGGGFSSCCLTK